MRNETYSFNLTIFYGGPQVYLEPEKKNYFCTSKNIQAFKRRFKIGNQILDMCKPNPSQNVTMSRTGGVRLLLGESFYLAGSLNESNHSMSLDMSKSLKFKARGKNLKWKL